jgi:RimJ/RimL family protein N-acetyltransferase
VLEKVGMRHVATLHVDFADPLPGSEHGEAVYEITRSEWRRARTTT